MNSGGQRPLSGTVQLNALDAINLVRLLGLLEEILVKLPLGKSAERVLMSGLRGEGQPIEELLFYLREELTRYRRAVELALDPETP